MPTPFRAPVGPEKSTHTPAIADCGPNIQKRPSAEGFSLTTRPIGPVHKRGHSPEIAKNGAEKLTKNNRSRFIKVRVSTDEHWELQRRADSHGQTLSDYVRHSVTAVHERLDVVAALEDLRKQVHGAADPAASATNAPQTASTAPPPPSDPHTPARARARLASHDLKASPKRGLA